MKTNASELYGHIETIEQRLQHLFTLREIQDETHGFQAFISFPFHPQNTQLENIKPITSYESLRFIAISRLVLDNIPHIKAFWMMLTLPIAQLALAFGADDLGSIMLEENVVRAAGTAYQMSIDKMVNTIEKADFKAAQRDTEYNIIRRF